MQPWGRRPRVEPEGAGVPGLEAEYTVDVGDGIDALGDVTNGNDDAPALSVALVGCTE